MGQRPDATTARDNGGGFEPHSEGQFAVLCVDVVNLGTKVEQYQDKAPHEADKAALVFASGERFEKELRIITVEMTLSMSEKANMRKFLESWRGKSYTPEEAEAGVPLEKLYGQTALVSVQHIKTRAGNKFAKVISIGPLPRVMPKPDSAVLEEYVRPKFFETRKQEYLKGLMAHRARQEGTGPTGSLDEVPAAIATDDDDLPF